MFLKDISKKKIDLQEIAEKYELPFDHAKAAIEKSISETLSTIFRQDTECLLTGHGCEINVFRENGVKKLPMEHLKKNVLRAIKYGIVSALQRESTLRCYKELRFMAGRVVSGYVSAVFEDRIVAELDTGAGPACGQVMGVCEKSQQTPKERGLYRPGWLKFYVLSVEPVLNKVPTLRVSLSRTSTGLTEGLLHVALVDRLLDTKIKCVKRAAGVFSLVEAGEKIPRECIKKVADELKERVVVHFGQK